MPGKQIWLVEKIIFAVKEERGAGVQEKMLLKSANFFLHTDMDM